MIGICALDKSSSDSPSLFLYSRYDEERIHFPISNKSEKVEETCFALMISLPMSKTLTDLFIPNLKIQPIENTTIREIEAISTTKIIQSNNLPDKESSKLHSDAEQLGFYLKMHETINEHPSKVYSLYVTNNTL